MQESSILKISKGQSSYQLNSISWYDDFLCPKRRVCLTIQGSSNISGLSAINNAFNPTIKITMLCFIKLLPSG